MSNADSKPASLSMLQQKLAAAGGASALAKTAIGVDTLGPQEKLKAEQSAAIMRSAPKPSPIIKPTRKSPADVIFYHPHRPNFGTSGPNAEQIRFQFGYYMTNDKAKIDYLRANAAKFRLREEKEEQKTEEKKTEDKK